MANYHEYQGRDAAAAPPDFQRIYIGSLDYFAKPADLEALLVETNLDTFQKIYISIDPISGRNPGYCFVEFSSHQEAATALDVLAGKSILGRTIKLGPCVPKGHGNQRSGDYRPVFQRWGDWKGADNVGEERRDWSRSRNRNTPHEQIQEQQGPYAALNRLENHSNKDSTRVRIDGLDKMIDQQQNDAEIQGLLVGFEIIAIGKRVIPYSLRSTPGNHHHCYVDLASRTEADRAVNELNGTAVNGVNGGAIRLSIARNGRGPNQSGHRQNSGGGSQIAHREGEVRSRGRDIMGETNWRRAGDA